MSRKTRLCPCGSGKKYRDCCGTEPESSTPLAWARPLLSQFLSGFWLPTLIFLAVPVYEIRRSLASHTYPQAAFWAQNDALNALSWACFGLAGLLLLWPRLRHAAQRHLDKLAEGPLKVHVAWVLLAYLGILSWFCFIRFCQYRAYLLPQDTTNSINAVYTFLHHGVLEYSVWGLKILSIHFYVMPAVYAPVLLLWNSPLALLFVEHALICSAPIAVYCLAYFLTESPMAGFSGMLLTVSTPYFYELLTSNLLYTHTVFFFLWGMFFLYRRNWAVFVGCLLLMIATKEQVPFMLFGMGLYAVYALRGKSPRNWAIGLAICAASAALWAGEMALVAHYDKGLSATQMQGGGSNFMLFKNLVPEGVPPAQISHEIVSHPFRTLGKLFSSPYRYYPLFRVLFSFGFLCLFAPMQTIPFWTTVFPHVLANPGDPTVFFGNHPINYADFGLHNASYVFGPVAWAAAHGIGNLYERLRPRKYQSWILVWALFFSAFGFKYAHRTLSPEWGLQWFDSAPRVMAQVPPKARVWAMEYLSPPLALRRWINVVMWGPEAPPGYEKFFKPDYVLLDKGFVVYGKPPYRDQMLTFLAQGNYTKIADDQSLVLLKSPSPAADPEGEIKDSEWGSLPAADSAAVLRFGRYILGQ